MTFHYEERKPFDYQKFIQCIIQTKFKRSYIAKQLRISTARLSQIYNGGAPPSETLERNIWEFFKNEK